VPIKVLFDFGRGSSDEDVVEGFVKKVHLAFQTVSRRR
jgi:hypothetical protein